MANFKCYFQFPPELQTSCGPLAPSPLSVTPFDLQKTTFTRFLLNRSLEKWLYRTWLLYLTAIMTICRVREDITKPMDKQKIVGIGERESWDIRTNQISTYDVEERNLSLESSQSERHFIVQSGSEYPRMSQSIDSCIQDSLLNRLIPGTRREQPAILC